MPRLSSLKQVAIMQVSYELKMIKALAPKLDHFEAGTAMSYALLESILMHIRNLRHFFYGEQGRDGDDLLVGEYGVAIAPPTTPPTVLRDEKGLTKRIHRRLAHLTEERLGPNKDWAADIGAAINELDYLVNAFNAKMRDAKSPEYEIGYLRKDVEIARSAPSPMSTGTDLLGFMRVGDWGDDYIGS